MTRLAINNAEYRQAIDVLAALALPLTRQEWQETRDSQVLLCENADAWDWPKNSLRRRIEEAIGDIELKFQWRLRDTRGLDVGVIGNLRDESAAVVMIMDDVEKVWNAFSSN